MSAKCPHPLAYYSAGRWLLDQFYMVGWPDLGVIKIGVTSNGRERYGPYLARGAVMLRLVSCNRGGGLKAEARLDEVLSESWPNAFAEKAEAVELLGSRGAGWTECYQVPVAHWQSVIDILEGGSTIGETERSTVRASGT